MSLVGNLEDLGLGDILQIITLSRKSGTLALRSNVGEGWIVFRNGLVCAAAVKGDGRDLRTLMLTNELIDGPRYDQALEQAEQAGCSLQDVLAEPGNGFRLDRLEEICQQALETAVLQMFEWTQGEFSFAVGDDAEALAAPETIRLLPGVNAQFLAMEGTRRSDEEGRFAAPDPVASDPPSATASADPISFADVADELAQTTRASGDRGQPSEGEPLEAVVEPESSEAEPAPAPAGWPTGPAAATNLPEAEAALILSDAERRTPIVVIDPHLETSEWVRDALAAGFSRVHIFQRPELGVQRIRQYLARAETPTVLIAHDVRSEPLTGARDAVELVARLRGLSSRIRLALLVPPDVEPPACAVHGVLRKPGAAWFAAGVASERREALRRALLPALGQVLALAGRPAGADPVDDPLQRLREASARLSDPTSRADVLSLVLDFAHRSFSRVALFVLKDGSARGIAGLGLNEVGGPSDAELRALTVPVEESSWLQTLVATRAPVRGAPDDPGDRTLVARLGEVLPREAYLAPILSGERVAAFIYADQLPQSVAVGDTRDLEVMLHQAGLALDRAVLERALAESSGEPGRDA